MYVMYNCSLPRVAHVPTYVIHSGGRGTLTNLRTGAPKERIYHANEIASTSSEKTKNNPEKVGDASRQFVRICRSFILLSSRSFSLSPLFHSLSPTPRSRGSYRQFSSSSSRAPTPQRYSKHTQHSSPTLRICSHLSSVPPPPSFCSSQLSDS